MGEAVFTPQQTTVLEALVYGSSINQAAEAAGIHRNTIANWRRESVPFRVALANAQYDRALLFREKAEELTDQAFNTLRVIMADEKASPSVRLRAALAVVKLVTTQMPPQKKVDITFADTMIDPYVDAAISQREMQNLEKLAQNAQSAQTEAPQAVRREHPKIGRNDVCPCGSGLKYKRCCLDKPLAAAAA